MGVALGEGADYNIGTYLRKYSTQVCSPNSVVVSSSFFHPFLSFMSLSFFIDFPLITSLMLFTTLMYLFSTPHGDSEFFFLHS